MSVLLFVLSQVSNAPLQTGRIAYGSVWHCKHLLNEDNSTTGDLYEIDFKVSRTDELSENYRLPKMISIIKSNGEIPLDLKGFGSEFGIVDQYFKANPSSKNACQFSQGFYDWGVNIDFCWFKKKPEVQMTIRSFNYEFRNDPARKNEKIFALKCVEGVKL
jgi:hypothetical protein